MLGHLTIKKRLVLVFLLIVIFISMMTLAVTQAIGFGHKPLFWFGGDPPLFSIGVKGQVSELQFTFDTQALVSIEGDNKVYFRSLENGAIIQQFESNGGIITSMALHPSEPILAASASDGIVWLWDYETGQVIHQFSVPATHQSAISFSPNGEYLAAGIGGIFAGESGGVYIWQLADFSQIQKIDIRIPVKDLAFSSDSRYLFSNTEQQALKLWRISNGKLAKHVVQYSTTDHLYNMRLAQNVPYLIASRAEHIYWWQQDGTFLGEFAIQPSPIGDIAISNTGDLIASGSAKPSYQQPYLETEYVIRIWKRADPSSVHIIKAHNRDITALAFNADQTLLASGSDDKTIRIWHINP